MLTHDDIISLIAETVRGNIRELEGVLNMIVVKSQLKGKSISQADVRALIKHNVRPNRGVSMEEVVRRIAILLQPFVPQLTRHATTSRS